MAITNKQIKKELEEKARDIVGTYGVEGNLLFKIESENDTILDRVAELRVRKAKNGRICLIKNNGSFYRDEHLGVLYRDKENGGIYTFTLKEKDITLGLALANDEEYSKKMKGEFERVVQIFPRKFIKTLFGNKDEGEDKSPLLDFASEATR